MTINAAIYRVLTTQFKKDIGEEALTMIKEAGYEFFKNNGRFHIKNPATERYVYISEGYRGLKINTYAVGFSRYYNISYHPEKCKFDFAGYLEKPLNSEYYTRYEWGNFKPTAEKFRTLSNARNNVDYEQRAIIRVKKQIADLQAQLERGIRYKVKYELELENTRKKLGLIR